MIDRWRRVPGVVAALCAVLLLTASVQIQEPERELEAGKHAADKGDYADAVAHLNNANTSADAALATVTQLPGILSPEEVIGLVEAVHKYRATLEEHEGLSASARARSRCGNQYVRYKTIPGK